MSKEMILITKEEYDELLKKKKKKKKKPFVPGKLVYGPPGEKTFNWLPY